MANACELQPDVFRGDSLGLGVKPYPPSPRVPVPDPDSMLAQVMAMYGFEPAKLERVLKAQLDRSGAGDITLESPDLSEGINPHLEAMVRSMLAAPEVHFRQPQASREVMYPFITPIIFRDIDNLSSPLREALIRFVLTYGINDLAVDRIFPPETWLVNRMLKELTNDGIEKPQIVLEAVIDSLLAPDKESFDGLAAPKLDKRTYRLNKKVIMKVLDELESAVRGKKASEDAHKVVDLFVSPVFSTESFLSFLTEAQKAIQSMQWEGKDEEYFAARFLKTAFFYLRHPEELAALKGFTDDYKRLGLENICRVGHYICSLAAAEKRPVALEEIAGADTAEAETVYPGITVSLERLRERIAAGRARIKVNRVEANGDSYYQLEAVGRSGRRKTIFAQVQDHKLVLAALEQSHFFLEEDDFGPKEHVQVIGAINADSGGQAMGQALGDVAFFTTTRVLAGYGGTREARREHEAHERKHLEVFARWPNLRKLTDPSVVEGLLYADRDRVDAQLLSYLANTPEDQLPNIWLRPWNTEMNGAKYSLAYLTWAYIRDQLTTRGLDLYKFMDEMEAVAKQNGNNDFHVLFALTVMKLRQDLGLGQDVPARNAFETGCYEACIVEALAGSLEHFRVKTDRLEELFTPEKRAGAAQALSHFIENPSEYWGRVARLIANPELTVRIHSQLERDLRINELRMITWDNGFANEYNWHQLVESHIGQFIINYIEEVYAEIMTAGWRWIGQKSESTAVMAKDLRIGQHGYIWAHPYICMDPHNYTKIRVYFGKELVERIRTIERMGALTFEYIKRNWIIPRDRADSLPEDLRVQNRDRLHRNNRNFSVRRP